MKMTIIYTLISVIFGVYGTTAIASNTNQTSQNLATVVSQEKRSVIANWDQFNLERIDSLIKEVKQKAAHSSYAVFDFDNTTAFLDIEEATLIYQLENLRFSMKPEILKEIIYKDIPTSNFNSDYNNKNNQAVNINLIGPDIVDSYTWLYNNYNGFEGDKNLSEIKETSYYKNFIVKMRYLYDAIGGSFDHEVSYPWVTYLFSGMSKKELSNLVDETIEWQDRQPVSKVTWESPADMAGRAGIVTVTWKNGFRLIPEMQTLYKNLQEAGVDVYVISASALDVIKSIVTVDKYGFSVPESHVYAMHPLYDKEGKLTHSLDPYYPQTQGKGKTETIKKFIQEHYKNTGPILVAGDSEGDQNMMSDFNDTRLVLIINRLRSSNTIIGELSTKAVRDYNNVDAKILLQGRDENKGVFLPSQSSILMGTNNKVSLP
ncbi:haloacid dehalogenase-like hydrolase [Klebsiella spallanzanii]|uniref:haloacid dehalogenase-like hydrolase n=1 Tax=Klebsiella spallanzanii TaxID=2587528 RepID=UPI0011184AFE|nr:haloacid dehalogenase-like hydrolase [Klebsiella spallanzanii]MDM4208055.1 haloacid dehalogenase-like hydrolase [Klebsiella spallanzanii]